MTKRLYYVIWALLTITLINFTSCNSHSNPSIKLKIFKDYFADLNSKSDQKWNYTTDTIKIWFDERKGEPIKQTKGQWASGKWSEWDKVMNSRSQYDTIWYDSNENAVKGYFSEYNDFYKLIGKGPTKTLRTYWFNPNDRIKEILIYWIPEENTLTSVHLKPIVEWAKQEDSILLKQIYPNEKINPSLETAKQWKQLLKKYQRQKGD